MANGDGSSIHVDLGRVPTDALVDAQCLCGKCLVSLHKVEVFVLPPGLTQGCLHCRNGAGAHDLRVHPSRGEAHHGGQRGQPRRLGRLLRHQQHHSRPVVDSRSCASCHGAVLLKRGLQLGHPSAGGVLFDVLVGLKGALLHWDGYDLGLELPLGLSRGSLRLRLHRKLILGRPVNPKLLRHVFRCDTHVVVVKSAPKPVLDHRVLRGPGAHLLPLPGVGEHVGGQGHGLLAAADHHRGIPTLDRLGSQMQRLQPAATDLVYCHCRGGHGEARGQGGLPRWVLPGPSGQDLAQDDLIHLLWLQLRVR
mmetsp:Transcript_4000/g.8904  ORF Transcript_4000/g.8904 Transcript_4000/m.8904 type:complete len:307 (+) Transcript_4000:354-1274(+)